MKESRVIHIRDGSPRMISNRIDLFVEEYAVTEQILNRYLTAGWEICSVIPDGAPNASGCSGFTVFLVREKR